MFAIIQTGGKQYRVQEGDVIRVESLKGEAGDKLDLTPSSWAATRPSSATP